MLDGWIFVLCVDGWMDRLTFGLMYGCWDGWKDEGMDRLKVGRTLGWVDVWMDRWSDRRLD